MFGGFQNYLPLPGVCQKCQAPQIAMDEIAKLSLSGFKPVLGTKRTLKVSSSFSGSLRSIVNPT